MKSNKIIAILIIVSMVIIAMFVVIFGLPRPELMVTIDGLNSSYHIGDKIQFYVKAEGYGPYCAEPYVTITKDNSIIWQKEGKLFLGTNCQPHDIHNTYLYGGTEQPINIKEFGTYTVNVSFGDKVTTNSFTIN